MKPALNTWWTHVDGVRHKVISVEDNEIITWSVGAGSGGFTWLGEPSQFMVEFKPI